eukprot:gene9805-10844_t
MNEQDQPSGPPPPVTGSLKNISDSKLVTFAIGQQKKSRFQKAREEQEAKKKQDDLEAAKVYESFVASFDVDEDGLKTFVRSGRAPVAGGGGGKKVWEADKPQLPPLQLQQQQGQGQGHGGEVVKKEKQQPARRQAALHDLLEEIQQANEDGEGTTRSVAVGGGGGGEKGSFDTGDPQSTNLYVGNLSPATTEEDLADLFGRYGAIASVKVMWPRSEEERARKRNCGFVSFHQRSAADEARMDLNDFVFKDYKMIVGWGKAVSNKTAVALGMAMGAVKVSLPADKKQKKVIDLLARFVSVDGEPFEQSVKVREEGNPLFRFLFDSHCPEAVYYRWRTYAFLQGEQDRWREEPFQLQQGGAQIERARAKQRDSRPRLSREEEKAFLAQLRYLDISRKKIQAAMGWAFDHVNAAEEIVRLIADCLFPCRDRRPVLPAAAMISALYLLNDLLHNSASPVKHATLYKVHIEAVLPQVFETLNASLRTAGGRLSFLAIEDRVRRVLEVWKEWSLFPPVYLVGLQAVLSMTEGDLLAMDQAIAEVAAVDSMASERDRDGLEKKARALAVPFNASTSAAELRWRIDFAERYLARQAAAKAGSGEAVVGEDRQRHREDLVDLLVQRQEENEGDIDGEPLDEEGRDEDDIDGIPMEGEQDEIDIDGEPLEDIEDIDGQPLEEEEDIDGEPIDD